MAEIQLTFAFSNTCNYLLKSNRVWAGWCYFLYNHNVSTSFYLKILIFQTKYSTPLGFEITFFVLIHENTITHRNYQNTHLHSQQWFMTQKWHYIYEMPNWDIHPTFHLPDTVKHCSNTPMFVMTFYDLECSPVTFMWWDTCRFFSNGNAVMTPQPLSSTVTEMHTSGPSCSQHRKLNELVKCWIVVLQKLKFIYPDIFGWNNIAAFVLLTLSFQQNIYWCICL